jgi:prolyl oligopeptidase
MPLTGPIEEIVHGTVVRDPYRWLENRDLPETEQWIRAQQRLCDRYFKDCRELSAIERRVRHYLDVGVIDQPARVRDRYFYRKRAAGQEQGCICMREISSGVERLLVDPSRDGRFTSVGIYRISSDGVLLAYEVRRGGEDRHEIRFVDVETATVLPLSISRGYTRGLAFSRTGFFYSHETDETIDEHRIYHQSLDSSGRNTIAFRVPRTIGSRLVLMANECRMGALWLRPESRGILADFWIAEIADETPRWAEVFRGKRAPYTPILWHDRILVLVETEAGSSQLLELSRGGEERGVFVREKKTPIRQVAFTRDRIFVSYLERGSSAIDAWLLNGQRAESIELPHGGTIRILPSPAQRTDSFFYSFESFDIPPAIYEHHAPTKTSALWHQQGPVDPNLLIQVEQNVQSKDAVQIPLTLVSAKRDGVAAGPRPVIMTSYGGFGVTVTPQFSVLATILIELGAILALPHIRGGGEFGKAWHDAGRAKNRQAAFDDFIAAAEWLGRQGITTPRKLAIFGGSNSGLLVGAAMTQRPDLFGAVLCIAPLLDMVRYEAFDQAVKWRSEYGTVEDREEFEALYAYSPYHQVAQDLDYPSTLFVTGDKDDRCNPAHVRKMAAVLQERSAQKSPVIVDYSEQRGHSPVLPLSVRISALARRIAFLCRELQIPIPSGGAR